jgi:hypothetical protein
MSRRKKLPEVRCLRDHEHVIPASVLEIRAVVNSAYPDSSIETSEKVIKYTAGQVFSMSSVRAAKDFIKFHGADVFELVNS